MRGIGDGIVVIMSAIGLIYGLYMLIAKKFPLYFKLSMLAVACLMLGYVFDICHYIVNGVDGQEYYIGYLGSTGSFMFLLTASVGYMDGIIDDGSAGIKKYKYIALIAPLLAVVLWIPNVCADISTPTKIVYSLLWIPALCSSYYNLKHIIIPDMGFGFIKAIRPFNALALSFTFLQLIHLTLWNFCDWIPLAISGIIFGSSCIAMIVAAGKGVKKWIL